MLTVKKEFKYDRRRSFIEVNPFTIAFVYPQSGEPFILKGGYNDISLEIGQIREPAIVHQTYWNHGGHRLTVLLLNMPKEIEILNRKNCKGLFDSFGSLVKNKNWVVTIQNRRSAYGRLLLVSMKRLPRKWIKELDSYVGKPKPKFEGRLIELYTEG